MRQTLAALLLAIATAAPLPAAAADAPRGYERRASGDQVRARPRGVAVDKLAEERLKVYDEEGVELTSSFVDPGPPRRIERRVYVREGVRPRYHLYGGFYGFDRWGVGRDGW